MEVFLFPLINVTLFPGTTKPLNIFEPRYLQMVKDSLKTGKPIAIGFVENPNQVSPVQPGDKIPFVREIAGIGYPQIIEERVNGTLVIFMLGKGRVRLGSSLARNTPYIVCEAELLPEEGHITDENQDKLKVIYKVLLRWIEAHIPDARQREIFLRNLVSPQEIVGSFANYLVRDYDLQQMVLEFNDINEKLAFLYRLTESSELTT